MNTEKWHTLSCNGEGPGTGNHVSADVKIETGSPWFSGHFPDEPILPGIALLSMVTEVIKSRAAGEKKNVTIAGIRRVRFRIPIRPGDLLSISLSAPDRPGNGTCTFKIAVNGETACSGMVDVKTS